MTSEGGAHRARCRSSPACSRPTRRLTQRGWQYIAAALAASVRAASARFLRANAGLYIYCIYDGHYDLSLIGKALQSAYLNAGWCPPRSATSLTQSQVEALARAYSIPSRRLTPHPPPSLPV